ncbi:helix-turn-helix domain-containing protein [Fusobacterium varium]|uniref:DNA-binding protein n=1 Tax=Fusobacterium TaxID=848 RepID=UPI0030D56027
MTREDYMCQKLGSLSNFDKLLVEKMVEQLGEWATIEETAKYFKRHKNTIYDKVEGGEVLNRRIGNKILIYTRSLIFLME